MSPTCESFRERLAEYLDDRMAAGEARTFREHVGRCARCRDEAVLGEPSLLFARAGSEDVSSDDVAVVLAGVRAGLALKETERKLGARGRPRLRRGGAIASAAALAAMVLVLPGSGRRPAGSLTVAAPAPAASGGFSPAGRTDPRGTLPADVTIYDWNPGAGPEEPRVVWIVDRSLDI